MLENPPAPESATAVKRYAPPNQRNRSTHRRKSCDRLDRTNSVGSDLEKNQLASSRFIALQGCSTSAASHLLNNRWTAAIHSYNNPKHSSEKPVMYSGGTSVWTQFRLPHQIMSPAASVPPSVSQRDFLGELRRQMQSANSSFNT